MMETTDFRVIAKSVIDDIAEYNESLEQRRVTSTVQPGYLRNVLPDCAPFESEPLEKIRADVHEKIMPGMTHWGSPKFMAFFPCGTSYPASIAEMYSNAFSGAYFNWICSPAATELETIVLDWVAKALGLPKCFLSEGPTTANGVIHGSATESIITTMVAARKKYIDAKTKHLPEGELKEEERWRLQSRLVVLGSACVHSSTQKAARIVGARFVTVPVSPEHGYAMQGKASATTLAELDARGMEPFYLTATLGTTDFCAVDDFPSIAEVLKNRPLDTAKIWVHVDAAYAGSALLLDVYQPLAKSIREFDSFNFGPHKWMLTTIGCSATFLRRRDDLVNALRVQPPYLQNNFTDKALVTDYHDLQISLGRGFRSLKLWFVLRSYGIRGLQMHIKNGINQAEILERMLRGRGDLFTVFTPAKFALLSLRVNGQDNEEINYRTKVVYDMVNKTGEFFLTSTVYERKFAIRVCTGVAGVRDEHVRRLFDVLVLAATSEVYSPTSVLVSTVGPA